MTFHQLILRLAKYHCEGNLQNCRGTKLKSLTSLTPLNINRKPR